MFLFRLQCLLKTLDCGSDYRIARSRRRLANNASGSGAGAATAASFAAVFHHAKATRLGSGTLGTFDKIVGWGTAHVDQLLNQELNGWILGQSSFNPLVAKTGGLCFVIADRNGSRRRRLWSSAAGVVGSRWRHGVGQFVVSLVGLSGGVVSSLRRLEHERHSMLE